MDDADVVVPLLHRGQWLAKLDIADAFYCWPVAVHDADFFGVRHPVTHAPYRFRFCPMGVRQSPAIQQRWAHAIKTLINTEGLYYCDPTAPEGQPGTLTALGGFLDDFLTGHAAHLTEWQATLQFTSVLLRLAYYGIPVKWSKNEWPAHAQDYTGLRIDTVTGTLGISTHRGTKLHTAVLALHAAGVAGTPIPRLHLASDIGKLQFACYAITEGQAHLVELYLARDCFTTAYPASPMGKAAWFPDVLVRLTLAAISDLEWWARRLQLPCHRRIFWEAETTGCLWSRAILPTLPSDADLNFEDGPFEVVTSDASGLGGGAWWRLQRMHHAFTAAQLEGRYRSSNMRELAMAPAGAAQWAHHWRGRRVLWRFDNTASVGAVNKRASMTRAYNALIREFLSTTVAMDTEVVARYLPGPENGLADSLSRLRGTPDNQDWQFDPIEHARFARWVGPFAVDACADPVGNNAFCPRFWSEADSCLTHHWAGLHTWCNPPFRAAGEVLQHFWAQHALDPSATSAVFVLPVWTTLSWWRHMASAIVLHVYPTGSDIFTSPGRRLPGDPPFAPRPRVYRGPTHWPVVVCLFPCSVTCGMAGPVRHGDLPRLRGRHDPDALLLHRLSLAPLPRL
jgi:hypothetical protein